MGGGVKVQFYLPNLTHENRDAVQNSIFMLDTFYECNTLDYLIYNGFLKPGSNILDVGANIGNHTVYFGLIGKAKHIYSFEPVKSTFDTLNKNVELNELSEIVTTYNYGCGGSSYSASIKSFTAEDIGGTSIQKDESGDIKVLDLDSLKFQSIDFVKIDTEGYEIDVLQGMNNILLKDHPILYIEIDEGNYDQVKKILSKYDYKTIKRIWLNNYLFY